MRISTDLGSASRFGGYEKGVELIGRAGFDAWDLSMFNLARYDWKNGCIKDSDDVLRGPQYLKKARELKQIGEAFGMVCNQSHAPYPCHVAGMRDWLRRALELSAEVGAEICVIHPDGNTREEMIEMYLDLLPFAKACGVRMAAENIAYRDKSTGLYAPHYCSDPARFISVIDEIGDPYLVALLDVAHAEVQGLDTSATEMIYALGADRLKGLHIHDNDKKNDQHKLPFTASIAFEPIVRALKEIGYGGYFTMEADAFVYGAPLDEGEATLKELARVARVLADMFEKA